MFSYPPLICLLEVMGADRVMLSVDYPYSSNSEGRDFVLRAPISEGDREKLAFANAARLLGLDLSGSEPRVATTPGG
jgi:predicted TIM-barrel fold metal-dependent hydrolase